MRMGNTSEIKVQFFKVEMPPGEHRTFRDVLADVAGRSGSITKTVGEVPVFVKPLAKSGTLWEGNATRVRMDALPALASLGGDLAELPIANDQGLGEETAFAYGSNLDVIAIQLNHFGVSASRLARYFSEAVGSSGPIVFEPIVNESAWAQLAKFGSIRAVEIGVAGLGTNVAVDTDDLAVESVVNLSKLTSAPTVHVKLAMGYAQGSMPVNAVRSFVRHIKGAFTHAGLETTKLRVVGRGEDAGTTVLDLLDAHLTRRSPVEYDPRRSRRIPYDARVYAVRHAWTECEPELRRVLKEK